MELFEIQPELASQILEIGNRKISLENGEQVKWINLNNQTCFAEKGISGCTYDNENVKMFINVPSRCKTVY